MLQIFPSEQLKRETAWIGDAVLALFARRWILQQPQIAPGERIVVFTHLTQNQFLANFGEPTAVEATIGAVYQQHGEAAAFQWIDENLMPRFEREVVNIRRKNRGQKPATRRLPRRS